MRQWLAESRCECQTRRSGTSGDYDRPVVTLADPGNMLTTHHIASLLLTTEAFISQIPEEKQDATMTGGGIGAGGIGAGMYREVQPSQLSSNLSHARRRGYTAKTRVHSEEGITSQMALLK